MKQITAISVLAFVYPLWAGDNMLTSYVYANFDKTKIYTISSSSKPSYLIKEYSGSDTIINNLTYTTRIECICDSINYECGKEIKKNRVNFDDPNSPKIIPFGGGFNSWYELYEFDTTFLIQGMVVVNRYTPTTASSAPKIRINYVMSGLSDITQIYEKEVGLISYGVMQLNGSYTNQQLLKILPATVPTAIRRRIRPSFHVVQTDVEGRKLKQGYHSKLIPTYKLIAEQQ